MMCGNLRILHNGSASAFQADGAGSIPAIRSGSPDPTRGRESGKARGVFRHGIEKSGLSCKTAAPR